MNVLNRLEKLVEYLIESPFGRLFKLHLHPADLTKALATAMEEGQVLDNQGGHIVPNHYRILLHTIDYRLLQTQTDMVNEIKMMKRYLLDLMAEINCGTLGPLYISVHPEPDIKHGDIQIKVDYLRVIESANEFDTEENDTKRLNQMTHLPASSWWLHLPDRKVQLGMDIIKIGRELGNDIILSDHTVSRFHAQLCWRDGIYCVENLSQTQPIMLNYKPVQENTPLKAGDLLQLGLCTLSIEQNL